jgi:YbgC/YbaW family acyl-CoA thioester hydrolase
VGRTLRHERRVAWGDTDASGAWTFCAALRYVEDAEVELLREASVLGDLYGSLPRIYVEARYVRPARFDDVVEVRLSLDRVGRTSLHYHFEIVVDGDVAAEGRLGAALIDQSGKAAALPEHVRASLNAWSADPSGEHGPT